MVPESGGADILPWRPSLEERFQGHLLDDERGKSLLSSRLTSMEASIADVAADVSTIKGFLSKSTLALITGLVSVCGFLLWALGHTAKLW